MLLKYLQFSLVFITLQEYMFSTQIPHLGIVRVQQMIIQWYVFHNIANISTPNFNDNNITEMVIVVDVI